MGYKSRERQHGNQRNHFGPQDAAVNPVYGELAFSLRRWQSYHRNAFRFLAACCCDVTTSLNCLNSKPLRLTCYRRPVRQLVQNCVNFWDHDKNEQTQLEHSLHCMNLDVEPYSFELFLVMLSLCWSFRVPRNRFGTMASKPEKEKETGPQNAKTNDKLVRTCPLWRQHGHSFCSESESCCQVSLSFETTLGWICRLTVSHMSHMLPRVLKATWDVAHFRSPAKSNTFWDCFLEAPKVEAMAAQGGWRDKLQVLGLPEYPQFRHHNDDQSAFSLLFKTQVGIAWFC